MQIRVTYPTPHLIYGTLLQADNDTVPALRLIRSMFSLFLTLRPDNKWRKLEARSAIPLRFPIKQAPH